MRRINIPRTDLQASIIVLGTDYFGSTVSRQESMHLIDHYLEAGGNVLDTAEVYASFVPGGEHQSETVIGEWLRGRQVRDQVVLSTKGAHPKLASMDIPQMSKAEIQSDHQENHERFQRIRRLQEKQRLSVSQIVLGYLTSQPFPVFPLIGPKTLADLRESIRNAGATLSQAALSYLEYGESP
jgi:aryl-alcohol dehydrogenase-like predicted oxidoreductase